MGAEYWDQIRRLAAQLGSDGCTGGTSWARLCCLEHDVHYRLGRTVDGTPISRREADARFRACMQRHSRMGWWSPLAWGRWLVVRAAGWKGYAPEHQ